MGEPPPTQRSKVPARRRAAAAGSGSPGRLRILLVLGSLEAFGPLSMDLYMPALPNLAADLETSDLRVQLSMSACMLGLGLGQLLVGPASDRLGRRMPAMLGVALFTVLSLACAAAPTIEVLLLARLLQGMAGGAGMVVAMAVVGDLFHGSELSRMLSLLTVVGGVAPVVAPILGGRLALIMDWRGVFLVLAALGAAVFMLTALCLKETRPRRTGRRREPALGLRSYPALLQDQLLAVLLLASAGSGIAFFAYLSMSSLAVQRDYGLGPQEFSMIFAANAAANMAGAGLSRLLVRRLGPATTYLAGYGLAAAAVTCLLVSVWRDAAPMLALVALGLYLLASGIVSPNAAALVLDRSGEHAGAGAALFGTVSFTAGPLIAPLAALGGIDMRVMGTVIAAAVLAAALLVWTAGRRQLLAAAK